MLMKRTRASSCSQVGLVLVYMHPFRRSSLFYSRKSQKITKTSILGLFKVIDVDTATSTLPVLAMISRMSVLICNRFHAG